MHAVPRVRALTLKTGIMTSCSKPWSLFAALGVSIAFCAALVTSVIDAPSASAHAALVRITPAAGAQLTTAPTEVVLEFDEAVSTSFARVVVTNAEGASAVTGKPTVLGSKVTQELAAALTSGGYRIAYQVVSDDGHQVSGESRFTLTLTPAASPPSAAPTGGTTATTAALGPGPGPGTAPAQTANTPVPAAPAAGPPKGDEANWLNRFPFVVIGGFGLLVIGAGVLRWERQRG